ncbi:hypothetical protein [Synechocystis sp. LKSZ1]|uniref:hypothetical protein n=1 Tax=Synechocystis sp. LKSZ1 TaxID=3144951 RepID=UPI00336BBBD2
MLELLWVHNPEEAQSEAICRTRLWERWRDRNLSCPFGICLRSSTGASDEIAFSSWQYYPPYLPPDLGIAIATNSDNLTEPMLFQIPFGKRPDQATTGKAQPLQDRLNWREIDRVELVSPMTTAPSPELQILLDTQLIRLRLGAEYCLEFGIDGEFQGQRIDLRPDLPLVIHW